MSMQRPLFFRLAAIGCASALALAGSTGVAQAEGEGGLAFDFDLELPAGSSDFTEPGALDALLPSLVEGLPEAGSDAPPIGSDGVEGNGDPAGSGGIEGAADATGANGVGGVGDGPDAGQADSADRADAGAMADDTLVRGSLAGVMALVSQVDEGDGSAGAMLAPQTGTPPPLPPLR